MFAPSIGVAEDIANANSTACLAAYLAGQGITDITVDMGDSLRTPSTITATTRHSPSGPLVHLGGTAEITRRPPAVALRRHRPPARGSRSGGPQTL
ncbi:PhzF family phenazine biosynthesis protein [Nonomuraea sp. NPDC049152]|uniref:PhzF family phenazine biosynthesis protein n=1 Tax=Nonomuraea sp. NPDC049152 TaxID=3154350 RepID=UPI00340426F9